MEDKMTNELTIGKPTDLMSVISKLAENPSNVDSIQKLIDMQERIMQKNAEMAFNSDYAELSKEIKPIEKTGSVDYKDKSTGRNEKAFDYAKLENIDKAIRPLLSKFGFTLSFETAQRQSDGGGLIVTGILSHRDGHSRKASIPLPLDSSGGKNNLQAMGSTLSYGRRYTTCMLLNIVTEGEDDNGSSFDKISIEQAAILDNLINETKSNKAGFLEYFGANSVLEIRADSYKEAIHMLNKKVKK
jgi:hypothetical protein